MVMTMTMVTMTMLTVTMLMKTMPDGDHGCREDDESDDAGDGFGDGSPCDDDHHDHDVCVHDVNAHHLWFHHRSFFPSNVCTCGVIEDVPDLWRQLLCHQILSGAPGH